MPKIKPFKAVRPDQNYVDQVVLQVENLSLRDAKEIRADNPFSYVNMLVPKLENYYLRASKEEQAYKKINENFEEFLDKGTLVKDDEPSIYIYQIIHLGIVQTGIWTVTSIDDYLNNTVKKHELTRIDREKSLMNYLDEAGIDANPVLITYKPVAEIDAIIKDVCETEPVCSFEKEGLHKLWQIKDQLRVDVLVNLFGKLPCAYIADGHHRAAAASLLGMQRRRFNLKHNGTEEYNFFSSVYLPTDQLKIVEFNRLVKLQEEFDFASFLEGLQKNFKVENSEQVIVPQRPGEFGMYIEKNWYRLSSLKTGNSPNPSEKLDVSVLQSKVLAPLLLIDNPRNNKRIDFVGGLTSANDLIKFVDEGEFDIAFTLFPTSIEELIAVADTGEVMPPKSTWFEPKFLAGLVIHQY